MHIFFGYNKLRLREITAVSQQTIPLYQYQEGIFGLKTSEKAKQKWRMKKIKSFECLDTYMQERKKTYQESAQRRTRGFLSAKQKDKGISVCETEGQGLFCLRNRRTREFVSAKHKDKGFSVGETEGQGNFCLRNEG